MLFIGIFVKSNFFQSADKLLTDIVWIDFITLAHFSKLEVMKETVMYDFNDSGTA